MGNIPWNVWRELLALLPADVAAVLPGARAALFAGTHGKDRGARLFADGDRVRDFRRGFGPVDCRWAERDIGAKKHDRDGTDGRRRIPGGVRDGCAGACSDISAGGERSFRAERL